MIRSSNKAQSISEILRLKYFPVINIGMAYEEVAGLLDGDYAYDENEVARFLNNDDLSLTFNISKKDGKWRLVHIYVYPGNVDEGEIKLPEQFKVNLEEIRPRMPLGDFIEFLDLKAVAYTIRDILPDTKRIVDDIFFNFLFDKTDVFRLNRFVFLGPRVVTNS